MAAPEIDIVVRSKQVPWVDNLAVEGPDYSAGTFLMEIRPDPGDTGTPLVSLANASPGSQGISCAYNSDYVDPETLATFAASVFTFNISEATMKALPTSSDPSEPVVAYYDVHVTPSGGTKFLMFYGTFTYCPGVTL